LRRIFSRRSIDNTTLNSSSAVRRVRSRNLLQRYDTRECSEQIFCHSNPAVLSDIVIIVVLVVSAAATATAAIASISSQANRSVAVVSAIIPEIAIIASSSGNIIQSTGKYLQASRSAAPRRTSPRRSDKYHLSPTGQASLSPSSPPSTGSTGARSSLTSQ